MAAAALTDESKSGCSRRLFVWGCIFANRGGDLARINSVHNAEIYCTCLKRLHAQKLDSPFCCLFIGL